MKIKLKLTIGVEEQVTEGHTLESAVNKLVSPPTIKARGKMIIQKNDEHIVTTPMTVLRLKMLFNKKHSFKGLFIKNLSLFLK